MNNIAKKNYTIASGGYIREQRKHEIHIEIKKGDDITKLNIPEKFLINLVNAGVIGELPSIKKGNSEKPEKPKVATFQVRNNNNGGNDNG